MKEKKKITYLVHGFESDKERDKFKNLLTTLRGRTGLQVSEVMIKALESLNKELK